MAAKGISSQAAKRKKTEEMADSPPKRVTRARAAKATSDVELIDSSTVSAKAPLKAATEKKKAPPKISAAQKKASAIKQKTQLDDEKVLDNEPAPKLDTQEKSGPKPKLTSSRGGRKTTKAPQREIQLEIVDAPKSQGRNGKAAPAKDAKTTAGTTRTRRRKEETIDPVIETQHAEPIQAPEPIKKVTRGRAAATTDTIASKVTTNSTTSKGTTRGRPAKKVQFQEEIDKENIPLEAEAPKKTVKSAMKPTGIRAKPVRKAAGARTITRSKKAVEDQEEEGREQLPLSPKKVNQVAKAGSSSSEDELAGEKTVMGSPSKSNKNFQTSPARIGSTITAPPSPSKHSSGANILASPARRPPPSPFKDGLKMSPKKVEINFSTEEPMSQSNLTKTPAKSSLLQESPRKLVFQSSVARPALASTQSPLKSSLLQSPARRPINSPCKSPMKVGNGNTTKPVSPIGLHNSPKPKSASPQQAPSSHLKAIGSPERTLQASRIMPEEQEAQPVFEMPSPGMADSPGKPVPTMLALSEANESADVDITMHDVEQIAPSEYEKVPTNVQAFTVLNESARRVSMESASTDELASPDKIYAPTPLGKTGKFSQAFATPTTAARAAVMETSNEISFTPLVGKLDSWSASSPNKQDNVKSSRRGRGMFSLGGAAAAALAEESPLDSASPAKTSYFEDELAIMDEELNQAQEVIDQGAEIAMVGEATRSAVQSSMESQGSEEYGDENAAPTEAEVLREEQDNDVARTCTPAKIFTSEKITPVQVTARRPVEACTVSKVPLRASADDYPQKATRQRSKSVGGFSSALQGSSVPTEAAVMELRPTQPETPKIEATVVPTTPSSGMKLDVETPGCTIRKGVATTVLKGAIVYVDVHTTEGADASSIFVDLLTHMGARCVKQWSWNPRTSMASSLDNSTSPADDPSSTSQSTGRVGITHVVYKDGGQRTLQKVRQSNGVVMCVGVGWVLDCERAGRWLDEADYAIDATIVPRGGGRRRKSMEPRALANMAGNLVPASGETAQTPARDPMSPTEEFLTFNTPASRRETFVIEPPVSNRVDDAQNKNEVPEAPRMIFAEDQGMSEVGDEPATPDYLRKDAQLIQRTCPPKQAGEMLFPINGHEDEHVSRRLLEARRKSMAFASKTRSPLGRTVSYGGEKAM